MFSLLSLSRSWQEFHSKHAGQGDVRPGSNRIPPAPRRPPHRPSQTAAPAESAGQCGAPSARAQSQRQASAVRSELHAVVAQEADLVGMLLCAELLRGLELLLELLEAGAAEVERDAHEHLLGGRLGVRVRVRVGVGVRVGFGVRVRVRVGVGLGPGSTETTRSVAVLKMASMKNLSTQLKPQLVRSSAMPLAASAYSSMLEAFEALPRLGVLPFMSSSLSAA